MAAKIDGTSTSHPFTSKPAPTHIEMVAIAVHENVRLLTHEKTSEFEKLRDRITTSTKGDFSESDWKSLAEDLIESNNKLHAENAELAERIAQGDRAYHTLWQEYQKSVRLHLKHHDGCGGCAPS